jgi:hypothetical protein
MSQITVKINKMSFLPTCFGLTRPSSGNYQLEEIITLYGFTNQHYHAVTARRRIRERMIALPSCYFYVRRSRSVMYEVYRKVPGLLLLLTASVKEDEGRSRSHFRKRITSVCYMTQRCEHALFLHEYFFDFMFCFVCDGWQNQAMCWHQVLHEGR